MNGWIFPIEWGIRVQGREPILEAAAWFNLRVAEELRTRMRATGTKQADVADLLGVKPKQVSLKLNGHSGYSVADLVALAIRFGVEILPGVAARDELFPPAVRPRLIWTDSAAGSEVALRQLRTFADLDCTQLAGQIARYFESDQSVPRHLMIDADLRRWVIGALSDSGFDYARLFTSVTEGVDLWVGSAREAGIGTFLSPPSLALAEEVASDYDRLMTSLRTLSRCGAIVKVLVAVVGPQLHTVLDDAIGASDEGLLDLPGARGAVRIQPVGAEGVGDSTVVLLEVLSETTEVLRSGQPNQ